MADSGAGAENAERVPEDTHTRKEGRAQNKNSGKGLVSKGHRSQLKQLWVLTLEQPGKVQNSFKSTWISINGRKEKLPHRLLRRYSALEVMPTSVPCMWAVDGDLPYISRAVWTRGGSNPQWRKQTDATSASDVIWRASTLDMKGEEWHFTCGLSPQNIRPRGHIIKGKTSDKFEKTFCKTPDWSSLKLSVIKNKGNQKQGQKAPNDTWRHDVIRSTGWDPGTERGKY